MESPRQPARLTCGILLAMDLPLSQTFIILSMFKQALRPFKNIIAFQQKLSRDFAGENRPNPQERPNPQACPRECPKRSVYDERVESHLPMKSAGFGGVRALPSGELSPPAVESWQINPSLQTPQPLKRARVAMWQRVDALHQLSSRADRSGSGDDKTFHGSRRELVFYLLVLGTPRVHLPIEILRKTWYDRT